MSEAGCDGYEYTVNYLMKSQIRFRTVVRELSRGKSVLRATFNSRINGLCLSGDVVDLGACSKSSSYYRFFDCKNTNITFCDYSPADDGVMAVDLEHRLPFDDNSFDIALLFFVMEHIWNVPHLLREIRRICRGHAILGTVLPYQYTPQPNDYCRYTEQGLSRLFTEAGFRDHAVFPVGHGPLTLALSALQETAHFAAAATTVYPLVWLGDTLINQAFRTRSAKKSVMTHISVLRP